MLRSQVSLSSGNDCLVEAVLSICDKSICSQMEENHLTDTFLEMVP